MSKFQKPSQELSIEETLSWTFDLYTRNFVTFFVPMLVALLVSGVFSYIISSYALSMPRPGAGASNKELLDWFYNFAAKLLAAAFTLGILSWIVSSLATGVVIKSASNLTEKGTANLGEAFSFGASKLLSVLVGTVIIAVLVVLGMIALIVPGIIIALMYSIAIPAILIEDIGAMDGLSRSRKLVSKRWLKTFVLLLIVGLIVGVITYVASLVATPFGLFGWTISSIVTAFVEPLFPISLVVYYYSMLAKEEQWQKIQTPPPPPF